MKHELMAGVCLLSTSIIIPSAAAHAQDAEIDRDVGNDIVVTATRREERLQDVPLAVTALGSEALRTRGVTTVLDLGTSVPGLAVSPLFGSEMSLALFIRGFGAGDASQGTVDMPVALYIDGVNIPRSQVSGLDLVTPERIEVLRGPQGQLFGRNAHSGVLQIVSRRPGGEWEGDFSAGLGTYGALQVKGRIDLPEIAGFKIQLSGNFRKHDGYIDNFYNPNLTDVTIVTDPASHTKIENKNLTGDFSALKTRGGRIAVERDFGDLNAFYSYDNTWAKNDQGYNVLYRSKDTSPTIYNGFSPTQLGPAVFSNFSGPGGSQLTFTEPLQGGRYIQNVAYSVPRLSFIDKSQGHVLNLTYTATDNLTLRAITGQRTVSHAGGNILNAAVSPVMVGQYEYLKSEMFSQELQAIYTAGNLNLTAGALYFKEDVRQEITTLYAFNCLFGPFAGPNCALGTSQATTVPNASAFGAPNFKRSESRTEAYGLYTQGTYTLGPVDLTAGVRYSNDTKKGARTIDRVLGIDGTAGIGVVRRNRFHTGRFDPAFTVKYNLNGDVNVYGRYAVGYRDGGSSVRSSNFSAFDEDEIRSWELGLKSQLFGGDLTLNLAAFHNTIKDQQLSIQEDPLGDVTRTNFINSQVDRKIKGLEVEVVARVLPGLTIGGNYTYLKANNILFGYDNATLVPFVPNATFNPQVGLIPDAATVANHPNSQIILVGPLGTPKHSGAINLDYVVPFRVGNVLIHADWTKTTRFINSSPELARTTISAAGVVAPQPGYNAGASTNRANARIAFRDIPISGGATAEFSLWAKNVFNHVDRAFAFVSGINSPSVLQPPRTLGAEFRVQF